MDTKCGLKLFWAAPIDGEITELKLVDGKLIATIDNIDFIVPEDDR